MAKGEWVELAPQARFVSPGESVRAQPWAFIGMAIAGGLLAGALFRYKKARKLLRIVLLAKRFL